MGKKNKKHQKALRSSGGGCTPPDYCEYYYGDDGWEILTDNAPSGYYCPQFSPGSGSLGQKKCEPAYPGPPSSFVNVGGPGGYKEPKHKSKCGCSGGKSSQQSGITFCAYEFRNGEFYFIGGDCQPGWYCPPDPIEYAKHNGPVQMIWSHEHGRVIVRMMPVPMV